MKITLKTPSLAVLIGLIMAVSSHAQSFLSNGLVAYYPFDGNVSDASGKNNNGDAYNVSYGTNRFSIPSKSAYFNASLSSYVNLPNIATNLSGLSKATFSFWIKQQTSKQVDVFLQIGIIAAVVDRKSTRLNSSHRCIS